MRKDLHSSAESKTTKFKVKQDGKDEYKRETKSVNKNIIRGMMVAQRHLIKVSITLKKVEITVRFPCSLAFTLKTQKSQVECTKMYDLQNGSSHVNQTIQLNTQAMLIAGKYQDKKITLTIYMVSANGKIPAGSATISPTSKILGDTKLPLQKCPDRNACVYLVQKFEVIEVETLQQSSKVEEPMLTGRQNVRQLSNSMHKGLQGSLNSSVADILRRSRESRQNSSITKYQNQQFKLSQVIRVPTIHTSRAEFSRSKVDRGSIDKVDNNRLIYTRERQEAPILVFDSRVSRVESNYTSSNQYGSQNQELQDQQVKVMRLQRQKAEYIKEMARLKGELDQVNEFRVSYLEIQLERLKEQSDNKSEEITQFQDAIKDKQRLQRQLVYQLQLIRQELEKRTLKLNSAETLLKKTQTDLNKSDKQLQQSKQQTKRLKEDIEELKLNLSNTQKKYELQSTSYKEQIKKLNEKLSISESEKQKATIELSNLLTSMQDSQKKGQISIKEKERNYIEERAKLIKKVDLFEEQKKKIEQENETLRENENEIQNQLTILRKKLSEEQFNSQKLSSELNQLTAKYTNSQKEIGSYQSRLQELQKCLQQQKQAHKNKVNGLNQQLASLKSEFSRTLSQAESAKTKNTGLEQSLKKNKSQCTSIQAKYQQLKKDYEQMKKEQTLKEKLTQTLTVQNSSQQQKINHLLDKLKQQKLQQQQIILQFQHQLNYLQQTKLYIQEDLNDYKQAFQAESHKTCLLEDQVKKLNQQVLQLNRQLLEFVEKEASLQAKHKEFQYTNKTYLEHLQSFETRNRQIKQQLNDKNDKIYLLQKSNKDLQHEKFVLQQNMANLEQILRDKSQSVRQNLTERQKRLNQKSDELSQLRKLESEMKSTILNLKSQVNQCKNLLKIKNEEKQQLLFDYEKLTQQLQVTREENNQIKLETSDLKDQKDKLERQIKDKQKQVNSLKQQIEQFRISSIQAMTQLSEIMHLDFNDQRANNDFNARANRKQETSRQESVKSNGRHIKLKQFPDEQMSNIQLEIVARKNEWMNKINSKVQFLQQKVQDLTNQIKNDKNYQSEREHEFQEQSLLDKEKLNLIIDQKTAEINHLQTENCQLVQLIEAKNNQTDQLALQVNKLQDEIHQLSEQLKTVHEDRDSLKQQSEQLSQEIQRLKLKSIKDSSEYEDKLNAIKQHFQSNSQSLKQHNHQLQSQYFNSQKDLIQNQKQLQSLQQQLQSLTNISQQQAHLKSQYQSNINNFEVKFQQMSNTLTQKDKQLNQVYQLLEQSSHQLEKFKALNVSLTNMLKNNTQKIHSQNIHIQKVQFQFRSLTNAHNQLLQQTQSQQLNSSQTQNNLQQQLQSTKTQHAQINSQYQLLNYEHSRTKSRLSELQAKNHSLNQQLKERQRELKLLQDQLHSQQQLTAVTHNEVEIATSTVQAKDQQIVFLKQSLEHSQQQTAKYQLISMSCSLLQTQIIQLQEQLFAKQSHFEHTLATLQQGLVEAKKQLSLQSSKEEDHRRQLRHLQSIIQQKQLSINHIKHQMLSQFQKDQLHLISQLQSMKLELQTKTQQLSTKQQQHIFQKQHLQAEILQKTNQIQQLSQTNAQNEHIISQLHMQLKLKESLNNELQQSLKKSLVQWQKQKSVLYPCDQKLNTIKSQIVKFEQFSKSIDTHSKQLIEIARKNALKPQTQNQKWISEILRELSLLCMKTKTKLLSRCANDKDKELIISDYRLLHNKLESAMKYHGVSKPIGFN